MRHFNQCPTGVLSRTSKGDLVAGNVNGRTELHNLPSGGQLVFLPLLTWLAEHHGWRTVGVVVACATAAVVPVVLTVLDWVAVLFAFWLCLEAVGLSVGPRVLIAGFAIGMNVGVVSLVPGGLGVQEGSQAAVLALFGIPFGPALLASVLFRFVYFLVPFIVSLPLYYVILRPAVTEAGGPASESH